MSPIPPNKEVNPNSKLGANNSEVNSNQIDNAGPDATAANGEEAEGGGSSEETTRETYEPLEQDPNARNASNRGPAHPGDDDDDDDEDTDTDSEADELDPDEHFAMLASSRAFEKKKPNESERVEYVQHSFDCDVFERKRTLESEEIHLDESRSREINSLMQSFKLPDECIPSWAKLVPEDVWKKNLLDCLNAKKLDLFASSHPILDDDDNRSHQTSS